MSGATHPARSHEFLSRLHDGDLTPAEKAHFESHRSHCDECRKAAADFEATLAYYRTSGIAPAPSDLSTRILRKLEASNRRRPGLGVAFGIDLRWAGAFTAAIVAVILGTSLLERQRASRGPRSIPVSFVTPPAPGAADALEKASKETLAASAETSAGQKVLPGIAAKDLVAAAPSEPAAPPKEPAAPPVNAAPSAASLLAGKATTTVAAEAPLAAAPAPAAPKPSRAQASSREFGGESAIAEGKTRRSRAESDVETRQGPSGEAAAAPIRLSVTALDDGGLSPAVLNRDRVALTEADRGRYVLVVGADGVPLDVAPESSTTRAKVAGAQQTPSLRAVRTLKELRFAPGDRARRLLARVE